MNFEYIFVFCGFLLQCEGGNYDGYRTYRVTPETNKHVDLLISLRKVDGIQFWINTIDFEKPIDIMVAPDKDDFFVNFMRLHNIPSEIHIVDVGRVLTMSKKSRSATPLYEHISSFNEYADYEAIQKYLRKLEKIYPDTVSVLSIGNTSQGRSIDLLKISDPNRQGKPVILIDAGIHAREWIAPASALYAINQLVENAENFPYLEFVDWCIIPVLNPDGYEFSHREDRLWRKTYSNSTSNPGCPGVDANRNFDIDWMTTGASTNPCSQIYAGTKPFSEPESLALKNFAEKIQESIKLYISLHSYGSYILYPPGYTIHESPNKAELDYVARAASRAMLYARGNRYSVGPVTRYVNPASGGSDDYMHYVMNISLAYTIELPEGGRTGFDPFPVHIKPIAQEVFEGIKAMGRYITLKYKKV